MQTVRCQFQSCLARWGGQNLINFELNFSLCQFQFYLCCKRCDQFQARNQEFFRAGEFSWNYGTSINILSATHEKNPCLGKILFFFSWELLRVHEKCNPQMAIIRAFFPKIGALFPIFEKGQGRPLPLPSSSYLSEFISTLEICVAVHDIAFRAVFATLANVYDGAFLMKLVKDQKLRTIFVKSSTRLLEKLRNLPLAQFFCID